MKIRRTLSLLNFIMLLAILVSCNGGGSNSQIKTFRDALNFKPDDRWVVLARPNSIWTIGTIVEIRDGSPPEDIGNIRDLKCFPEDVIIENKGEAPSSSYNSVIDYNISFSLTIGLPSDEIIKAGLKFGSDGGSPTHKTVIKIDKATEIRWSYVRLEEYISENFAKFSPSCKRVLTDQTRCILDKIYQINKGSIEVLDNTGAKVDLSTPKFKTIADAAIKAGFNLSREGSLMITGKESPITFAVRRADFEKSLSKLGLTAKGTEIQPFEKAMKDSGASIPY